MITNFFKKKKDAEDKRLKENYDRQHELLKQSYGNIIGKDCPFIKNGCNEACAHFKHGRVLKFPSLSGRREFYLHEEPKCRLWKD